MTPLTKKDHVVVLDKAHLIEIIEKTIAQEGFCCDLNFLDVSKVKDFKSVFNRSKFFGNISKWDMSGATELDDMFGQSKFNGDISKWNVSSATSMAHMFSHSQFNGDISNWNTGRVTDMSFLFKKSLFTGDISNWDVSSVITMVSMFVDSPFNGDISQWNTSRVENFQNMFLGAIFQGDIAKWNTSSATDMSYMFASSAYRSHLSDVSLWNVENVKTFEGMWHGSDGPRDLSAWRFALDANTNYLLAKELVDCDRPSAYHWRVALAPDIPAVLRAQDQAFLDHHRAMVTSLCESPQESAAMLQRMWLQEHGSGIAMVDILPLPETESGQGVGV